MRPHKPVLFILITLALVVSLSGCIIIPLTKYYDIPAEEVASVQFYALHNRETSCSSGFDKTFEPVYTIPEEDKEEFLEDFSKLKFSDSIIIVFAAIDYSFFYGDWVVRINFTNGQYTFYSCAGYGETYNAEGECISATQFSCDDKELNDLVSKYYVKKVPHT